MKAKRNPSGESPIEEAVSLFEEGFSCAQAVLAAHASQFNMDPEAALRVACAFGSGVAGRGETCGAVNAALMVIGLRHGRVQAGDEAARDLTYDLAQKLIAEFEARYGSICCRQLLGYDLSVPEEYERAEAEGLFTTLCPRLVRDVGEILAQLGVTQGETDF